LFKTLNLKTTFWEIPDSFSYDTRSMNGPSLSSSWNDDGLLTGVSTNPEEDDTLFLAYIPFPLCGSLAA
jgi:hypothetical protein